MLCQFSTQNNVETVGKGESVPSFMKGLTMQPKWSMGESKSQQQSNNLGGDKIKSSEN